MDDKENVMCVCVYIYIHTHIHIYIMKYYPALKMEEIDDGSKMADRVGGSYSLLLPGPNRN